MIYRQFVSFVFVFYFLLKEMHVVFIGLSSTARQIERQKGGFYEELKRR